MGAAGNGPGEGEEKFRSSDDGESGDRRRGQHCHLICRGPAWASRQRPVQCCQLGSSLSGASHIAGEALELVAGRPEEPTQLATALLISLVGVEEVLRDLRGDSRQLVGEG